MRRQQQVYLSSQTTTTTYLSDPFEGDINPKTSSGQRLHTLAAADQKKEELLSINKENLANIMSAFRHDASSFGWGCLINDIKTNNNVIKLKILEDFYASTLALAKAQAIKTWHNHNATATTVFPMDMVHTTIDPVDTAKREDKKTFFCCVRA